MVQEKNKRFFCSIILILVIALYLYSFAIINFNGFAKFCTCDMYEDTVYSMLAQNSKSFFPEGWVFGNQYYIVATPVLCSLFYGITGNINSSMALATSVMTVLIILSLLFLMRPFTDSTGCIIGVTAILGCMTTINAAVSLEGQLFYILASYYACYLIAFLIVIGDYIHAVCSKNKRGFGIAFIISMALCFANGIQSLRLTAVLIIPLLLTEFLRILVLLGKKEKKTISDTWKVSLRTLLYAGSNLLGAIYIQMLKVPNVTIYGNLNLRNSSNLKGIYEVNLRMIQKITGFYYALNEKNGLVYLIPAVFFACIVVIASAFSINRFISERQKGETGGKHLFGILSLSILVISLVELFIINLVMDMKFRTPYIFVWYPFVAVCCVVLWQYLKPGFWKAFGAALLCIACIGNWYTGYAPAVKKSLEVNDSSVYKKISDYIVENEYTYIYGDWRVTCPIAAYTNGRALAGSSLGDTLEVLNYINPQDIYGEKENRKAVYVFTPDQYLGVQQYAENIGADLIPVAEFEEGYYKLFISDKQLMHY